MSAAIHPFTEPVSGRPNVHTLSELRALVGEVSGSLDAVCELMRHCPGSKVEIGSLLALLGPMAQKLSTVSCDLNDMRL